VNESAGLTLGTAGHVDHGKTTLVRALTSRDTDRLAQEKERGLSIELGYAPLTLPSGRRLSVVDVPGHERFIRTMVAGATGIDAFLLCVAADDGVMPQTTEHLAVLRALGVVAGVVAITKADVASPAHATAQIADELPGIEAIPVAASEGRGLDELLGALERATAALRGRRGRPGPTRLH
jgi:selenocysteine-specific elongation factor